eukprot:scaffold130228_cov36-Attheya_sp.AAC.1
MEIHPVVMNYLRSDSFGLRPNDEVNIFTEYKCNDVLYRPHPNFQNGGAWYEWSMVVFEMDNNDGTGGFYPYGRMSECRWKEDCLIWMHNNLEGHMEC